MATLTKWVLTREIHVHWPARSVGTLHRRDFIWAGLTGLVSAALFAVTLTGHAYLGDGPETIAGVSSVGILHDPGYPVYVIAAHLFTLVIPFGSEAFRVNLFSLVCGAVTVAGLQLLARRCGVARWAAVVGALALAVSPGFWYYAGFAKHDLFSGLLLLVTIHVALAWQVRPDTRRLAALAGAVGLGLGSSWPLEITALPVVALVLLHGYRHLSFRAAASAIVVGVVTVVAAYGFVMVRAAQNPAVNWGGATTISRLWKLVDRSDFTTQGNAPSASSGATASSGAPRAVAAAEPMTSFPPQGTIVVPGAITSTADNYFVIFSRELGVLAVLLAALGLVATLLWRRSTGSYALLAVFLANLIAAKAVVDFGGYPGGLDTDLVDEGFVLGCYFAMSCWLGFGISELVHAPAGGAAWSRLSARARATLGSFARARITVPALAVVLGAAVVVPTAVASWPAVRRSSKPFADSYAKAMFSELPRHAVLFIRGAELAEPLLYRQIVDHQRQDVTVIAADGLGYDWYRQQVTRSVGMTLPLLTGDAVQDGAKTIEAVARRRPVYLDPQATEFYASALGYRPVGLLSALASGRGQAAVSSPARVDRILLEAERQVGLPDRNWNRWPNQFVNQSEYAAAALNVARAFYQRKDYAGMLGALRNVLAVEPGDPSAVKDLGLLKSIGYG
jgi:hypothetical protein